MTIRTREEAIVFLRSEAKRLGKSLEEFIDIDIRRVLETAWAIQQRTGKAVPFDDLVKELNE